MSTALVHLFQVKPTQLRRRTAPATSLLIRAMTAATRIEPNFVPSAHNPLSLKECFILMLLGSGKTAQEAALILGFTPMTLRTYERRLRRKLGTQSRTHAFCLAIVRGYLRIKY